MNKLKSKLGIVFFIVLFSILVIISEYIINNLIHNDNYFEDSKITVSHKERDLKNIFVEGKNIANAIIKYDGLDEIILNSDSKSDFLKSYFNINPKISNISIYSKELKKISEASLQSNVSDLEFGIIKNFLSSNQSEKFSTIYLKTKKDYPLLPLLPYIPKISYMKKIVKNNETIAMLVIEFNLMYNFMNLFDDYKYDFILVDGNGNSLYHYDEDKSWSAYYKNYNLKDEFKDDYDSILKKDFYIAESFQSFKLNVPIDNDLVLVLKIKDSYLQEKNDVIFKKDILFLLSVIILSFIILTLLLILADNSIQDLDKAKRLSFELKKSQRFSNLAQQVAHIGLWEVDEFNNVVWSKWMYKILDIENSKQKPSYEMFVSLVHPEDKQKFDSHYKHSKHKHEENLITYRILTGDGKIKWIEQRWRHYYDNNKRFKKTIGSLYDISKRKLLEDNLNHKNSDLQMVLDSFFDSIVMLDLDINYAYFNRIFENLTGFTKKELMRKNFVDLIVEEEKELLKVTLVEAIEKNRVISLDTRLSKKNGEIITINCSIKLMKNERLILLSMKDITHVQKDYEKYLINQSRLATLGEMLIDLTYQWRQPLSIISTSASFLKLEHELNTQQKEETIDVLSKIIDSSNNLSNTIDDFKYYVEERKDVCEFSINTAIEKVLIILGNQIFQNEIDIIKDFDEDIEINNMENSFMQVLVNIIKNSIEALVEYPNQKKLILISTSIQKDVLEITITDNAHGIEEKSLPLVFNEFFTTKNDFKSNGLGLFLAKSIVNSKLKGNISVQNKEIEYENEKYIGASFKITVSLLT